MWWEVFKDKIYEEEFYIDSQKELLNLTNFLNENAIKISKNPQIYEYSVINGKITLILDEEFYSVEYNFPDNNLPSWSNINSIESLKNYVILLDTIALLSNEGYKYDKKGNFINSKTKTEFSMSPWGIIWEHNGDIISRYLSEIESPEALLLLISQVENINSEDIYEETKQDISNLQLEIYANTKELNAQNDDINNLLIESWYIQKISDKDNFNNWFAKWIVLWMYMKWIEKVYIVKVNEHTLIILTKQWNNNSYSLYSDIQGFRKGH